MNKSKSLKSLFKRRVTSSMTFKFLKNKQKMKDKQDPGKWRSCG